MEITEIIDEDGNVGKLKITASTKEQAREAAYEWCEENNCHLNSMSEDEGAFIASVCGDDYN